MRIAHLTWSMGVGGIQTMLTDIVNVQVQEGHEVGIFVIDTYVSETIMNKLDPRVEVFFMGRTRGKKAVIPFVKLNINLWKFKPDIIHSHAGKLTKIIFSSVPKVATIHGEYNPIAYKGYKALFAISKAVQTEWKEKANIDTILVENGIHCNLIKKKQYLSQHKDSLNIVQVSRVYFEQKGQDILVHAFAKLQTIMKGCGRNKVCFLHFIGDGVDMDRLHLLVQDLQLEKYVVFEGFKDREWVFEHLCDYDLFVQASRTEPFGLTVAEACAAKVPVIVSDIEGPLEIIGNGRFGKTFHCCDVDDLAEKLFQFVINGCDQIQIEQAYQNTLLKYDVSRTALRYLEEYNKILN